MSEVSSRCYSRVGLLGNPSDGYNGKVISFALRNFFCEVVLIPSPTVKIVPHLEHDGFLHASLHDLSIAVEARGYTGGLHLLLAACKVFTKFCQDKQVHLPNKGFTASYETNIPRQCGLSGSSAIILAALDCLAKFYDVSQSIPLGERPGLALAAETELGITAGLQDRVIQTFGGMLYMDFSQQNMADIGQGRYEVMEHSCLPDMYILFSKHASSSGKIHSNVRRRWEQNDAGVRHDMHSISLLAEQGRAAIQRSDWLEVRSLMDKNFDLRRRIFGESALGSHNIQMIDFVRSRGGSAKLTGSGGAAVAMFPEKTDDFYKEFAKQCEVQGYTLAKAEIFDRAS